MTTTQPRTRNRQAKRAAIIKSALHEFAMHGYAGARTDSIAEGASVSVGTIYKVFTSKEELANQVLGDCVERVQNLAAPALMGGADARVVFDNLWSIYTELFFADPDTLVFYEHQLHDDFIDTETRQAKENLRGILLLWIGHNMKLGIFKPFKVELMRALAFGSILRLMRETRDNNTEPTRADLKELNELVWQAIAVDAGK